MVHRCWQTEGGEEVMKLLNYLRATLFALATVLLSVTRPVFRFGWWCIGKAVRPGIETQVVYPRTFVEHQEHYQGYLIVVINRRGTERRAIIEDGGQFVARIGPWEVDLGEMIDSAKHEIDDIKAEGVNGER